MKIENQDSDFVLLLNTEGQEGRHYTCRSISFCKKENELCYTMSLYVEVIVRAKGEASIQYYIFAQYLSYVYIIPWGKKVT